jgi:cob(I)alamin adenosyltransferase
LYSGERKPKTDQIFHALGTVDELNSSLGIANEYCLIVNNGLSEKYDYFVPVVSFILRFYRITEIQSRLFDLGAAIATPTHSSSEEKRKYTEVFAFSSCVEYFWVL